MSKYYIENLLVTEEQFASKVLIWNDWELTEVKTNIIGLKNYYYKNIVNGKTAKEIETL